MNRAAIWVMVTVLFAGCGGGGPSGSPGTGGSGGFGSSIGGGGRGGVPGCPDLFAPTLQTFSIDVGAADWAAIQTEFQTVGALTDSAFVQHEPVLYPVVFRYGGETVSDAYIHLRGDSSWREAVADDGANGKMQLAIEFDHVNPSAEFHGTSKIRLDMPRTDPTFLRDRIGNSWLRSVGIPAVCATSARLVVNGAFYGLYVAEQNVGRHLIKEFFPGNADGDLFDGGWTAKTNEQSPNRARQQQFWDATTPAALTAIVDVPGSVIAWAAEALLNDGDGYWGGDHNFFIYDQGAKGYVFFPHDLDSSLDYLERFDSDPITWWSVRADWQLPIPQHYLIVIGDDGLRAQYVAALRAQLGRFDVAQLQSWIDAWVDQIRPSVAQDPHRPIDLSPDDFEDAIALARRGIAERADFVTRWLACWDTGSGADADGDGFIWCHDCRDDAASVHAGAPEICGNVVDDNCNGAVDEGC
jgi:CotH protein/putative metal-binding protein